MDPFLQLYGSIYLVHSYRTTFGVKASENSCLNKTQTSFIYNSHKIITIHVHVNKTDNIFTFIIHTSTYNNDLLYCTQSSNIFTFIIHTSTYNNDLLYCTQSSNIFTFITLTSTYNNDLLYCTQSSNVPSSITSGSNFCFFDLKKQSNDIPSSYETRHTHIYAVRGKDYLTCLSLLVRFSIFSCLLLVTSS